MEKIEWPKGKKFAVCLSHDVDRVRKTYQVLTNFIIERRLYHLYSLLKDPNPYWCFERIMEIEKKYNVRSTFFFLKETKKLEIFKPHTYILSLGHYDFKDQEVKLIIKRLDTGGWEIGLHGSYDSYKDESLMLKEKKELEGVLDKPVFGIRQHYLNLDELNTWIIQRKIGFRYDASFGYRHKIGFRDGKIRPFKPFNDDFMVIPLNVMDGVVFSNYNSYVTRWKKIRELINETERKGGVISFLWHQRVFNEKEFPGWTFMYEKIIKECLDRKAWIVPCEKIYLYLSKI